MFPECMFDYLITTDILKLAATSNNMDDDDDRGDDTAPWDVYEDLSFLFVHNDALHMEFSYVCDLLSEPAGGANASSRPIPATPRELVHCGILVHHPKSRELVKTQDGHDKPLSHSTATSDQGSSAAGRRFESAATDHTRERRVTLQHERVEAHCTSGTV
ncbi:hypothetical protein AaE_006948 [Aphanomyces astaci]|uniref:Uncharacterized protein n=1 Tax=Aphanomyces astaci TaxID=112090 RepID=A0A6A5AI29_APHAT|nr:hypothetical protein AaE_006948 [Aphanomyces astaci]